MDLQQVNQRLDWILAHGDGPDRMLLQLLDAYRSLRDDRGRELMFLAVCSRLLTREARNRWSRTG